MADGGLRRRPAAADGQPAGPSRSASPARAVSDQPVPKSSYTGTYLAWITTGFFGSHHFLLGRDTHAFLWMTTFAGFGVGVARDLWRIPEYVDDANGARVADARCDASSPRPACLLPSFPAALAALRWLPPCK